MRYLQRRQGVVSRLYKLPRVQSGDGSEWQGLPDLRCWKVRRVRLVCLRRLRERLRASWVQLLHFLRSWKKHELRQDWLRRLRCRNVFCRRDVDLLALLRRLVQCGGSVELLDVRCRKERERREDWLHNVSGREV